MKFYSITLISVCILWGCEAEKNQTELSQCDDTSFVANDTTEDNPDSTECNIDTDNDPNNCGSCGKICPHLPQVYTTCSSGECLYECLLNWGDCNNDLEYPISDGCEINLLSDSKHCKECDFSCGDDSRPNIIVGCEDSTCVTSCEAGFIDCNEDLELDGCEIDSRIDQDNCGVCGHSCPDNCVDGVCEGTINACQLFPEETPHPQQLDVASDGNSFALLWEDRGNRGLWIAGLDGRGNSLGEPVRLWDFQRYNEISLGYDGQDYILAWSERPELYIMRLSTDLEPISEPIHIGTGTIYEVNIIDAPNGALILWIDSYQLYSVFISQNETNAPTIQTLGDCYSRPLGVAVSDGFIVTWERQMPPDSFEPVTLVQALLDSEGILIDTPEQLQLPFYDSIDSSALTSVADGAILLASDNSELYALGFDEQGQFLEESPDQPDWHQVIRPILNIFNISGDSTGAWIISQRFSDGNSFWQATRVLPNGEISGSSTDITRLRPGWYYHLELTSVEEGMLITWIWVSEDSVDPRLYELNTLFLEPDGRVVRPCD